MERSTFRHRPGSVDSFIEGAGTPIEASEETTATLTVGLFGETEKFWAPGNLSITTQTLVDTLGK
jgi:hypothetical protein